MAMCGGNDGRKKICVLHTWHTTFTVSTKASYRRKGWPMSQWDLWVDSNRVLQLCPLSFLPGTSITGDSEATVTGPIGRVDDQMPLMQKVGFYVFSGSKRGQEPALHGNLLLKAHSHRPSDQGIPQEIGRLEKAGLLKLLGLEGSLTLTQVKQKG